jgi:hypothetical protein
VGSIPTLGTELILVRAKCNHEGTKEGNMRVRLAYSISLVVAAVALVLLEGMWNRTSAQSNWQARANRRISADLQHELAARVPLILVDHTRGLFSSNREAVRDLLQEVRAPQRHHLLLPVVPQVDRLESFLTHELTHHFAFEILPDAGQVPPWLDEGLSEFERARWTADGTPAAPMPGGVPRIDQLPTRSDRELGRAVFEFIGDEFGTAGIRRYLASLRDMTNADAIRAALGLTTSEFDREFERYMKAR